MTEKPQPEDKPKKVSLDKVFSTISTPLKAILYESSSVIEHDVTKGDASEFQWLKYLKTYLPKRYTADKGFVIDSDGLISEQQDIIIYDRQYTPTLLDQEGVLYVPAESVYGVIEVKQELNREYVTYAGQKIASVRKLKRESVEFTAAGATGAACLKTDPKHIIGGLVCLKSGWADGIDSTSLLPALDQVKGIDQQIDIVCCLGYGSFVAQYNSTGIKLRKSYPEAALVFFFLNLLTQLRTLATVCAIDYDKYSKSLEHYEKKEAETKVPENSGQETKQVT